MTYRLSLEAEEALIRIYRYGVNKFGIDQATEYYFGLIEHFQRIAENPYQFPPVEHIKPGYRACVFKVDTIYYRIGDEIEIMAIIGRQNFEL